MTLLKSIPLNNLFLNQFFFFCFVFSRPPPRATFITSSAIFVRAEYTSSTYEVCPHGDEIVLTESLKNVSIFMVYPGIKLKAVLPDAAILREIGDF